MRRKAEPKKAPAAEVIKDIRRATRKHYGVEEKSASCSKACAVSLNNVPPADVYFGRAETIIRQRERIKRKTIELRRLLHRSQPA